MWEELKDLKRQFPLLEYLRRHNWTPRQIGSRQEFVGLCPLHTEQHPSTSTPSRICSTATAWHGVRRRIRTAGSSGCLLPTPAPSLRRSDRVFVPARTARSRHHPPAEYWLRPRRKPATPSYRPGLSADCSG